MRLRLLPLLAALALSGPASADPVQLSRMTYDTVLNAGSPLPRRLKLNLNGTGVSCADDAANKRTNCTFSVGTVYQFTQSVGSLLPVESGVNFTSGLQASDDPGNGRTNATLNQGFSPTWTGTHVFSNAATIPGVTAPAATRLQLQSPLAPGTTSTGSIDLWASAGSNSDYIVSFSEGASHFRVWNFTGTTGAGPTLNIYNDASTFIGGLAFTSTGLLPNSGSMVTLGSSATQWAGLYAKAKYGTQQAGPTSGAVSITASSGETVRVSQSGIVTSVTLSTCAADEHFTLILVGNGSAGVTTIVNAKLTGGVFAWPGNAVRSVLYFGCDTTDSMWIQIGTTSTVS